jgi:PIN domain nuclease of toxin-antitoxin system
MGVVQLVEVEGKLVSDGSFTLEQVRARLEQFGQLLDVQALQSGAQAASASYYARRKPYYLRLGDALCLGLAETLGADVLAAEHVWATIPDLPFAVTLIRFGRRRSPVDGRPDSRQVLGDLIAVYGTNASRF